MAKKRPLYPHVPKSRKTWPVRPSQEFLRTKIIVKMAEETDAGQGYDELAYLAESAGRHDIALELTKIADTEREHYRKLEELERRLR